MKMRKRKILPKAVESGDWMNPKSRMSRISVGKLYLMDPSNGSPFNTVVYSWVLWRWK